MNKQDWTYKKLGDVTAKVSDGSHNPPKGIDYSEYPMLSSKNVFFDCFNYDSPRYLSKEEFDLENKRTDISDGDILLTIVGTVGRTCCVKNPFIPFVLQRSVAVLKPKRSIIESRFLMYVLHSLSDFWNIEAKGVAQKGIYLKQLATVPIPVPPIAEQERIVAELDLLQGIIEKKKEQLKAYDQLAQSIFYTMFGDIEEDTPVSEYISALSGGKSLAGETECKNKVLKTGAVTYDYFRGNEVKNLPADYQPIKEHLLNDGDILISRMNTLEYVGACAYVWKAPLNTYLPDRLWRATLKDNINPIFLWFSLIQDKAKEQIRSMASGTSGSMKNISIPRFLTVKIKCIPLSLQDEFSEKIEAIERQKALVQQSIEETQTMFDCTMDKYFG